MKIVRLEAALLDGAAEIEASCFAEPWSKKSLELLLGDSAVGFAVLDGDTVAAYGGMMTVLDEGQITNIAVHPDFRRRGYGRAVTEALLGYGVENGLSSVYLEVRRSNDAALLMYEKCGFQRIGVRKGFYRAPTEDAVLMQRKL